MASVGFSIGFEFFGFFASEALKVRTKARSLAKCRAQHRSGGTKFNIPRYFDQRHIPATHFL